MRAAPTTITPARVRVRELGGHEDAVELARRSPRRAPRPARSAPAARPARAAARDRRAQALRGAGDDDDLAVQAQWPSEQVGHRDLHRPSLAHATATPRGPMTSGARASRAPTTGGVHRSRPRRRTPPTRAGSSGCSARGRSTAASAPACPSAVRTTARVARAGSPTPPCPPSRTPRRAGRSRRRPGASCRSSSGSRSSCTSVITAVSTSPASPMPGSTRTAPRAKTSTTSLPVDEARHVEVVDGHVEEEPAGRAHVLERRRRGIAAGDAHDVRLADLARRPRRPRPPRAPGRSGG